MTNKLTTYFAGLGIFLGMLTVLIATSPTASAVVDNDPDCNDGVAVINCGAFSPQTLREKAARNDVPRIFNAFDISQNDLDGRFVDGIVWRDGRVTVGGEVVATGAMTAGRNYGGTPIADTNAGKYPTSRFATEGQTAFVRMVDGKFDFAVIKACGNPVSATPTKTPQAEPVPEKIKVCDLRTWEIITIKESEFDKNKHTKNLDKCRNIKVCELATYKIIKIKLGEFDKTKHSRDLNDCKKPTTPQGMIEVCEIATGEIIEIKESEYNETKHTKDFNVCKEEETPVAIAETGPSALLGGVVGSSALGYGGYSYLQSRRHLLSKFLNR